MVWLAYSAWRIFYFSSSNYTIHGTEALATDTKTSLIFLINTVTTTIVNATIEAWLQTIDLLTRPLNSTTILLTLVLIITSFMVTYSYLRRLRIKQKTSSLSISTNTHSRWGTQSLVIGLASIIFAIIPFWAAGLPIGLEFPWDRFMLAMMFGAALVFVGLLDNLVKTDRQKIIILSLAISLAIGRHFETANTFRRDWNNMQNFFWQLSWRMPDIEPGTMIITHELPHQYYSDNSLTAPLNWIYAPELNNSEMPFYMVYTKARLGSSLPNLSPDTPINFNYRALSFSGSTSQAIVIYFTNTTCLRVMDPILTNETVIPNLPYQLTNAIPLSDLNRIASTTTAPKKPPKALFGEEPQNNWCYYFEQAEISRQNKEWERVVELGNQAQTLGLVPYHPTERLPFLEAYAHQGNWKEAEKLTIEIHSADEQFVPGLCYTWQRINNDLGNDSEAQAAIAGLTTALDCDQVGTTPSP